MLSQVGLEHCNLRESRLCQIDSLSPQGLTTVLLPFPLLCTTSQDTVEKNVGFRVQQGKRLTYFERCIITACIRGDAFYVE